MDDAIVGGSSSEFLLGEPTNQIKERLQERDDVFRAYPVMQARIDQLKQRIDHYRSVDAIDEMFLNNPELFMIQVAKNKERVNVLREELAVYESLLEEHLKPQL